MCALHSLGVAAALSHGGAEHIFPDFPGKSIAPAVNKAYAKVFNSFGQNSLSDQSLSALSQPVKKIRSRDARHVATQMLCDAVDTKIEWVVNRGGWALDSIQTVFNYIGGSDISGIFETFDFLFIIICFNKYIYICIVVGFKQNITIYTVVDTAPVMHRFQILMIDIVLLNLQRSYSTK
jgi:hypothetical protein